MMQMCRESLALLLKIIFEAVLNEAAFPDDWKKGNIGPVHNKNLKTIIL